MCIHCWAHISLLSAVVAALNSQCLWYICLHYVMPISLAYAHAWMTRQYFIGLSKIKPWLSTTEKSLISPRPLYLVRGWGLGTRLKLREIRIQWKLQSMLVQNRYCWLGTTEKLLNSHQTLFLTREWVWARDYQNWPYFSCFVPKYRYLYIRKCSYGIVLWN